MDEVIGYFWKLFGRDPKTVDTLSEYVEDARALAAIYSEELFRAPEPMEYGEWLYWMVEEDEPAESVRAKIRETDEWKEKHPTPPAPPDIPTIDTFVNNEAPEIEQTYLAVNTVHPAPSDLAHNFWRRLVEGFSFADVKHGIAGEPFEHGGMTIPPGAPWFGYPPPTDYGTFVGTEIAVIAQTYREANNGTNPAASDLAFNTWRRLALFWTLEDVLHGIKGEALESGGDYGAVGGLAPGPGPTREGRVVTEGRSFRDASGLFFPLGQTLFWALRGWKLERDRLCQNLRFLADHRWDYIRILGDVGWDGNEIDSTWPDYEQLLGELIDCAYKEYGLRTEITVWGGSDRDPLAATDRVVRVVNGREEEILNLEAANESYNNGPDLDTLHEMVRRLKATGCLVGPSSPLGWDDASLNHLMEGSTLCTMHLDRAYGDHDWRFVRQPWDLKYFNWPTSQNEPKGPESSVSACSNPLQLTMNRVVGVICGAGAYVLHNAAGVFGQVDPNPSHPRPANLWEMPGIDPIMKALRAVDALLPPGVENWTRANNGWTPPNPQNPLNCDYLWEEGDGRNDGANKNYSAQSGNRFVNAPTGVRGDGATFRATWACDVRAFRLGADGLAQLAFEGSLAQGQSLVLGGTNDTLTAYVIQGTAH